MGWLLLAFLALPFVELFVLLQSAQLVGVWWTVLLVVAVGIAGSWLVKRQGVAAWRRLVERVQHGEMPGTELVDGALILFAGALLLTPGFVTDVFGLALLLPPTRAVVRGVVLRRVAGRVAVARRVGPYIDM